jgi:hypothetical protein
MPIYTDHTDHPYQNKALKEGLRGLILEGLRRENLIDLVNSHRNLPYLLLPDNGEDTHAAARPSETNQVPVVIAVFFEESFPQYFQVSLFKCFWH